MRAWSATALWVVAIVCGINVADTARRLPSPSRVPAAVPANVVMRHEQRFAAVRPALRAHGVSGIIGYFSDLPPAQMRADARSMEAYFLSQFALAPWILDANSDRCTWAIANLLRAAAAERIPPGYGIIEDLGDGVLLLRRSAP